MVRCLASTVVAVLGRRVLGLVVALFYADVTSLRCHFWGSGRLSRPHYGRCAPNYIQLLDGMVDYCKGEIKLEL